LVKLRAIVRGGRIAYQPILIIPEIIPEINPNQMLLRIISFREAIGFLNENILILLSYVLYSNKKLNVIQKYQRIQCF